MDLSPSTIYRWVAAGYDGMTNMELRRKVGYRPRRRAAVRAATRHSARRSYAAFLALRGRTRAPRPGRWTPSRAPGRTRPACSRCSTAPAGSSWRSCSGEKTSGCVAAALEGVRAVLGADGTRRVFRAVLTDNGAEFSDEGAIAAPPRRGARRDEAVLLRPAPQRPEGRLRAQPRRDQEAAARGAGLRFDRLSPADTALAMSHVNSEPRGAPRLLDARARLQGDARGRCGGAV